MLYDSGPRSRVIGYSPVINQDKKFLLNDLSEGFVRACNQCGRGHIFCNPHRSEQYKLESRLWSDAIH
jgi:hypothetical protein